ncbi:MAG: EVE domain-containing protein [Acidobacteriota bacterium]|nr:EVE domain-containing protein [Acidobacteriota bacterium]
MAYWLLKTEPSDYAYADLEADRQALWDGVGNNLALKHLRQIRRGDQALIYHTGRERMVVGIAEVTSDPFPDPERDDPRLVVVEVKPKRKLAEPISLAEIKSDPELKDFDLVRLPRLSVMPVTETVWKRLLSGR